jgi:hypothetical protein
MPVQIFHVTYVLFSKSVGSVRLWLLIYTSVRFRNRAVGIATDYGLDDGEVGVRVPVESRIFSCPRRPDRLWCPRNLLSNGYWGLFPRDVKLTTHFQLVPRSRKRGSIYTLSIRLHGVVLNQLITVYFLRCSNRI